MLASTTTLKKSTFTMSLFMIDVLRSNDGKERTIHDIWWTMGMVGPSSLHT
jgi:hypothetical protein